MLIGITGVARSGKDSCANILVSQFGFTKLGFADGVRDMAKAIDPFVHTGQNRHFTEGDTPFARYSDTLANLGYEDAKQCADVRRLLQRIGTEAGRQVFGEQVWVSLAVDRIWALEDTQTNVVLSDVRFPNEAAAIKDLGGYVIRVLRPGYDNGLPALHPSEALIAELEVDATISATNLDELEVELKRVYAYLQRVQDDRNAMNIAPPPEPDKVYLAGPWAFKAGVTAAKAQLIAAGIDVISTWTEQPDNDQDKPETFTAHAQSDWDEVDRANVLVLLNLKKSDGKASEMGAALAMGKRVIVVGKREGNIFYHLPQVEVVETLDDAIERLLPPLQMPTPADIEWAQGVVESVDIVDEVNGLTPEENAHYAALSEKHGL